MPIRRQLPRLNGLYNGGMANPNPRTDQIEPYQFKAGKEQAKIARKAGIASGKAKRKKASLLKCAKTVLEADIPDSLKKHITKLAGELDEENDTLFTAATAVMAKEAMNGNVQAFRELKDIMRMIEENVTVDESIEDDALSKALEERAKQL